MMPKFAKLLEKILRGLTKNLGTEPGDIETEQKDVKIWKYGLKKL